MLIWKGRRRNAPETPPIEVKNEINIATTGGSKILVSTPETGKNTFKNSIGVIITENSCKELTKNQQKL
ncbi:MAG: hypothetical protein QMD01_00535 [Thermodesulfovibrionales bacterium]|nr:hypothetical protein [Thermodesulfovibrionales bacterium]